MDPAILSATSGLLGSLIGALSSLAGSWLNQQGQLRTQLHAQDAAKREALYVDFIVEASKRLAEAVTHQTEDPAVIVGLYSAVERMRLVSSREVIHAAEELVREVAKAYESPNLTFEQLREKRRAGIRDPLKDFGEACRMELRPGNSSWHGPDDILMTTFYTGDR
jgi:hypothetical protein